jgi:cytochrome oxidase Cu insertion factor (SCO1/SenC/PrrC family)
MRIPGAAARFLIMAALASGPLPGPLSAAELSRSIDFDYEPPVAGSYKLPVVKRAADGEVLDTKGKTLRLQEVTHGRITILSFIYTRCSAARACPYATGVLMQLHKVSSEDPGLAKNLRLVSLSFDPVADTPTRMAAYAALVDSQTSAAQWHFLTTRSKSELQPILDGYGQAVDKKRNPLDPTGPLNHTLRVFLIDQNGDIRNIYSADTLDLRLVLADVRTLQMELAATNPGQASVK